MSITVIIRTMGRPSLDRALASVQAQGLPDVQVLVIDAKSRGLRRAQAAQAGLDEAQTPWALFLDDDDELLPGHLLKLSQALKAQPQAVAAYTGVVQLREGSADVLATWDRAFEPWELLAANALPIHAVLFDRVRLRKAGVRFDTSFDTFEDWDFWLQVQAVGAMVHVPGVSARYWVADAPPSGAAGGSIDLDAPAAAQSMAQIARHGDDHYAAIWRKWWTLAPAPWWHQMWRAARDEPVLRRQWQQAEEARVQAEEARAQTTSALHQANQAFQEANSQLRSMEALDRARQAELAHVQQSLSATYQRLADEQAQHRITQAQRDEARIAEQGARWHLQAVLASRAWRITAPLRWLGRQVRRVARLRHADARRNLWWRLRHRSYPRPALLAAVLPDPYQRWMEHRDGNGPQDMALALAEMARLQERASSEAVADHDREAHPPQLPLISVLMPVYNPPLKFWDEAIESLRAQWYPHWELCMADDASTDPQVRERLQAWAARDGRIRWVSLPQNGHISAASNAALALARGSWVALFDQDDLLPPQALWRVVQALQAHPEAGLVYSDEDKVDESGKRFGPYFKPAFDIDLLRGQNMISHLGVYRRSLLQAVGGFRVGYEGSQDHDLALRCVEQLQPSQVVHIPRVLYHWRVHQHSTASGQAAKPYALNAGVRAVQDHLQRCGIAAQVQPHPVIPHHVVMHDRLAAPSKLCLLLWGVEHTAEVLNSATADALKTRLHEQGMELSACAAVADWPAACVQVKAWGALGHAHAVLLVHTDVLQQATDLGAGMASVHAHLHESGVGAVGWAVREPSGALHDAGWVRSADGTSRPVARGSGWDTHGYYGQLCLAHRVSALSGGSAMVRLAAVQPDLPGIQLQPSFRAVWTPLAQWVGVPMAGTGAQPLIHGNAINPTLVLEHAALQSGYADPAFSPHLCHEHADHRMAPVGETAAASATEPPELAARARTASPS